jgi:CRP-like cAMP-binding protein
LPSALAIGCSEVITQVEVPCNLDASGSTRGSYSNVQYQAARFSVLLRIGRIFRMNEEEQVELLSKVDIFEDLQEEEIRQVLRDLLRRNAEINIRAREVFYTPQEPDGKLFILKKGRVRIYKMEGSREFTLEVVDAGTVFGEVAFTDHRLRDAYAEATEPTILLSMERADVERLILQKPKVGLRLVSLLSERLHYYETRIEDVTLKGVPARLASLILFLIESEGVQVPGEIRIPTRYTHEHLGTMIGANREAVTRAFGRLQDEGALQLRRRIIYVSDVQALERVAGRLLEEGVGENPS